MVVIGLLIGGMVPFLFAAMAMEAVGRRGLGGGGSAAPVQGNPGHHGRQGEAEYGPPWTCSRWRDQGDDDPSLLPVLVPIVVGLVLARRRWRVLMAHRDGPVIAISMCLEAAWDNARSTSRKDITAARLRRPQGRGDRDTSDPYKDTAGPAVNRSSRSSTSSRC